ncbi:MAG: AAA family ATPase [Candidatus Binatia bacterium]
MYNDYFGLSSSPFSVTPDPRFFYNTPVYQEAYANLRYGIEAKKGFIVVTGEVGTGKTTLLRKLLRNLGDTVHSVFIFNTDLSFPELLPLILHDLGLVPQESNKVAMLQQLNDFLIEQLERRHIVAVLVDEAQNLSEEALEGLRLLSNLETDQEKLLQIVLMGQPELEKKLDQPMLRQLKQRVALQSRLTPLQDAEVAPYIDFRLQVGGYTGKGLFDPDALRRIAFYSQGIPRLINVICDNVLINAYARSEATVSAESIEEVARDLRLRSEVQVSEAEPTHTPSAAEIEPEAPPHEAMSKAPRRGMRRAIRVGAESLLAIILGLVLASVINPQDFRNIAGGQVDLLKRNLNQWLALVDSPQVVATKAIAETPVRPPTRRIIIEAGATIRKIAAAAYGTDAFLGMDLIKEYNPHITNLNRVIAGDTLSLPSLTQETMLRKQPDGSYRLIAASFPSEKAADQFARLLGDKGYQIEITPRKVSDKLLLHRVEIDGLKDLEEANRAWEMGLRNEWLTFAALRADIPVR